jgi:sugar fermentation stimulation protein A
VTRFPELQPLYKGTFLKRPNRFVVHCELPKLGTVIAHMPNPGRMGELLLPGASMYLTRSDNPSRKTPYTAVAVERNKKPIFLHTHLNNTVARHLLEAGRIPGLKSARILKAEAKHGSSRFDFLLEHRGQQRYLEVKSVTLFGNRVAMFPDAPTERGRKHLNELAELSTPGAKSTVLFLIHSLDCDYFIPDYHTDRAFAETLFALRDQLSILPIGIGWTPTLQLKDETRTLSIPWTHIKRHLVNRGMLIHVFHHRQH